MNDSVLSCCTNDAEAQESAEAYVLNRLPATELERYEEHLLTCARCQDAIEEFDVFLAAAKVALAEIPEPRKGRRASGANAKSATG